MQVDFASNVLLEQEYTNNLFSFAYQEYEKYQHQYWNGLINHVNNTRNENNGQ
jgi:hypothetical protein|nr:MAG: hypothetical protein [uncultured cyanophage]